MRFFFLIFISLITGCATTNKPKMAHQDISSKPITIYENDKKGIESLITNQSLKSFNTDYTMASAHKAFAQSVSGAWNWKSNRTSKEHAIKSALIGCQRNNKKSEDMYPCKIINIDGKWLN